MRHLVGLGKSVRTFTIHGLGPSAHLFRVQGKTLTFRTRHYLQAIYLSLGTLRRYGRNIVHSLISINQVHPVRQ